MKPDHKPALAEARRLVPRGLYLHKEGVLYLVTDHITDSTNGLVPEYPVKVVYHSLDRGPEDGHCRLLEEFIKPVPWPDGSLRARFVRVEWSVASPFPLLVPKAGE